MKREGFALAGVPVTSERRIAAFTLVELLVVVGIVGLLVAILAPELMLARSLARSAVCASNLGQLNEAFVAAQNRSSTAGNDAGARYPRYTDWPRIPQDIVPAPQIYVCPEAPEVRGESLDGLKYVCANRGISALFADAGRDPANPNTASPSCPLIWKGPLRDGYNEFVTQDHMTSVSSVKNDGYMRIWKADGRFELLEYHCGEQNQIWLYDTRPMEIHDSGLARMKTVYGPPFPFFYLAGGSTNYGINPSLGGRMAVPHGTIVLLDYDETYVDLADPFATYSDHLIKPEVARHRGRMNVLFADHAVRTRGPSEINPAGNLDLWKP